MSGLGTPFTKLRQMLQPPHGRVALVDKEVIMVGGGWQGGRSIMAMTMTHVHE
jgi:hypothetical protein